VPLKEGGKGIGEADDADAGYDDTEVHSCEQQSPHNADDRKYDGEQNNEGQKHRVELEHEHHKNTGECNQEGFEQKDGRFFLILFVAGIFNAVARGEINFIHDWNNIGEQFVGFTGRKPN